MAVIYYPSDSVLYQREVVGQNLTETFLSILVKCKIVEDEKISKISDELLNSIKDAGLSSSIISPLTYQYYIDHYFKYYKEDGKTPKDDGKFT